MPTFRRVLQKINYFFQDYYPLIWFTSIFALILTGFLHFEYKQNHKDFIYWKNLLQQRYYELEQFALIMIMLVITIKIILVVVILVSNSRTIQWYDELTQLEVKKRYADYLLLRLIADIDNIETKYLQNKKPSDIITLKGFILAHETIKKSIENFRKDARKLLTPNEMEIVLPIEEVYGVLEHEMHYVRKSRFSNLDIQADDNVIKKLVNP